MPIIRKVQKAVPGLAKFLGVESQGILAMEASNQVYPVLEMEDYLGPNGFSILRGTLTLVGDDLEFEVPENRFWRLKWMSFSFAPAAGQAVTLIPYLRKQFQATNFILPLTPNVTAANATANQAQGNIGSFGGAGFSLNKLNAFPGDFVGIRLADLSLAGAFSADLYVQYQELQL